LPKLSFKLFKNKGIDNKREEIMKEVKNMSITEICLIIITICLVFITVFLIGVLFSIYKLSFKTMDVMTVIEGKVNIITDSANDLINDSKRAVGIAEQILNEAKDITKKINSIGEGSKLAKTALNIVSIFKSKNKKE
jgi:uncharacterized protein YoxC